MSDDTYTGSEMAGGCCCCLLVLVGSLAVLTGLALLVALFVKALI